MAIKCTKKLLVSKALNRFPLLLLSALTFKGEHENNKLTFDSHRDSFLQVTVKTDEIQWSLDYHGGYVRDTTAIGENLEVGTLC